MRGWLAIFLMMAGCTQPLPLTGAEIDTQVNRCVEVVHRTPVQAPYTRGSNVRFDAYRAGTSIRHNGGTNGSRQAEYLFWKCMARGGILQNK